MKQAASNYGQHIIADNVGVVFWPLKVRHKLLKTKADITYSGQTNDNCAEGPANGPCFS